MDSRKYLLVATALAAMTAGGWVSWRFLQPPALPQTATVLPAAMELADFSLLDQHGNAFTRDSFKGEWNLVFFGFTHCPDVCPVTLQVLADARRQMQAAGRAKLPRIIFISVDPERDTPALVGQYVAHFGDGMLGVSGDLVELRKLTSGLGIYFEKSTVDGDSYSVDHSAAVLVIDPDGRFHALFGAPHSAAGFAHDLPLLMQQR